MRDHFFMYVLCAIVAINIIAIVLLNNRLAEQSVQQRDSVSILTAAGNANLQNTVQVPVRTVLLEPQACTDCFDIQQYIDALNNSITMKVETAPQDKVFLFRSNRLPAIAFNKSLEAYPNLIQGWDNVGYTMHIPDGDYAGDWYILPTLNPPYYSTTDTRVHGRVSVTYITMRSCKECYDVFTNRQNLNASRITPYAENIVDAQSSEGQQLIAKYNITNVPTIIMDKEAAEYTNLQPGWQIVGTVESDGSYVLRDLQRMNVIYYDLAAKKLMKP